MTIPVGYSQVDLQFGGTALPTKGHIVFGVQNTGAATPTAIATQMNVRVIARICPQLNNTTTYEGCLVKNGPDATGPFASVGSSQVGGVAGAGSAPNIAYLIVKNSTLGGREGRGRIYVPGVTEANVDQAGVLTNATVTALASAFAGFLADLTTDGVPMVLLHKSSTIPSPVTSLAVSTLAATQRRRMRR